MSSDTAVLRAAAETGMTRRPAVSYRPPGGVTHPLSGVGKEERSMAAAAEEKGSRRSARKKLPASKGRWMQATSWGVLDLRASDIFPNLGSCAGDR